MPTSQVHTSIHVSFNPHPARRPDATTPSPVSESSRNSFQSSSGQKAGCNALPRPNTSASGVSILIRPEGRMQPVTTPESGRGCECFNPHPARRPDATRLKAPRCSRRECFNPHPARRPDATWIPPRQAFPASVGFNPHPARRPDATRLKAPRCSRRECFNPHPARRPDATRLKAHLGM